MKVWARNAFCGTIRMPVEVAHKAARSGSRCGFYCDPEQAGFSGRILRAVQDRFSSGAYNQPQA
jgi:hypothetical protein